MVDSIERAVKNLNNSQVSQEWSRLHKLDVRLKEDQDALAYVDVLSQVRSTLVGADISKLEQTLLDLDVVACIDAPPCDDVPPPGNGRNEPAMYVPPSLRVEPPPLVPVPHTYAGAVPPPAPQNEPEPMDWVAALQDMKSEMIAAIDNKVDRAVARSGGQGGRGGGGGGRGGNCYKCGKPGHYAHQCPGFPHL